MMKNVLDKAVPSMVQFSFPRYIKCGLEIYGAFCIHSLRVSKDKLMFIGDVLKRIEFGVYRRNEFV